MHCTEGTIASLTSTMKRHEIPTGLLRKLMKLSEHESIEFVMCSSASLRKNYQSEKMLKEMLEILAQVPKCPQVQITFLGRPTYKMVFDQAQLQEEETYSRMMEEIFAKAPSDGLSLIDYLKESWSEEEAMTKTTNGTVRYLFCGGTPEDSTAITELLQKRANPMENPVTFLNVSSPEEDSLDNSEFMAGAKSLIPSCTQLEGFWEEAAKVHKNQGLALPYTQGLHLARCLVAAMNPHDLNSLDASVPLTKATFDIVVTQKHTCSSDKHYRTYFDGFLKAQKIRPIGEDTKRVDRLKKMANWDTLYEEFLVANLAHQIPAVQAYQRDLQQQQLIQQNQQKNKLMGVILTPLADLFHITKATRYHKSCQIKAGNEYLASELGCNTVSTPVVAGGAM